MKTKFLLPAFAFLFAIVLSSFTVNEAPMIGWYLDTELGLQSEPVSCDVTSTSNPICTIVDSEGEEVIVYKEAALINPLYKVIP